MSEWDGSVTESVGDEDGCIVRDCARAVRIEHLVKTLVRSAMFLQLAERLAAERASRVLRMSPADAIAYLMQLVERMSSDEQLALLPQLSLLLMQARCERLRWQTWSLSGAEPVSSPMGCRKLARRLEQRVSATRVLAARHERAVWLYVRSSTELSARRRSLPARTLVFYPGEPALYSNGTAPTNRLLSVLANAIGYSAAQKIRLQDRGLRSVRQRYVASLNNETALNVTQHQLHRQHGLSYI